MSAPVARAGPHAPEAAAAVVPPAAVVVAPAPPAAVVVAPPAAVVVAPPAAVVVALLPAPPAAVVVVLPLELALDAAAPVSRRVRATTRWDIFCLREVDGGIGCDCRTSIYQNSCGSIDIYTYMNIYV